MCGQPGFEIQKCVDDIFTVMLFRWGCPEIGFHNGGNGCYLPVCAL